MLEVLSLPDFAYGELQIPVENEEEKRQILEKLNEAGAARPIFVRLASTSSFNRIRTKTRHPNSSPTPILVNIDCSARFGFHVLHCTSYTGPWEGKSVTYIRYVHLNSLLFQLFNDIQSMVS